MRELSRALAFDPDNAGAMRTLVRLLAEPPRELPPEVRADLERATDKAAAELAPFSSMSYALFLLFSPFVAWMGIRNWPLAVSTAVLVVVTVVTAYLAGRRGRSGTTRLYPPLVVSTLAISVAGTLFGPFVFVPALTVVNTLFFVLHLRKERTVLAMVAGCVPVAIPAALQWIGVLPHSYAFEGNTMRILPWMHDLRQPMAPVFLLVSSVGLVFIAGLLAQRFRESLRAAEQRLAVHAWQMSKLLPREPPPSASG
jgi:hypothetical protein